ncbi:DNA-processing protein DprA [Bordetella sp. 15P40C-2]|uniref:DNA-processing protein DprA n=1 Tax=Bordetella sp. 15P40C-2 TaxID=2572246 RepID=UPI0013226170|nr:DNA-processing protein DprA [Bordetella sp. 15P40C-2]MVW71425.1 DNA-protecting protein DprA [Bordetella sp. 15P40C-2]
MPLTHSPAELSAWLRFSLEPGLTPALRYPLLSTLGLPEHIYSLGASALAKVVPQALAIQLAASTPPEVQEQIERTLQWVDQPGHTILTLADAEYPQNLLTIADPPLLLYVNGDPGYLSRPALAVVGARNATPGGCENARAFAQYLAGEGWCVVSGLAQGVDAAAHEGALQAGPQGAGTVAIMGTGIDRVYPARHRDLAHRIAEHGALVSELPLGMGALPHHFPARNRLVAGLARGVLVVEAARQSGSLITARLAGESGREVFAIPGSIHSPLSRGCHALIRQGAKLVETAQDITDELGGSRRSADSGRPAASTRGRARGQTKSVARSSQSPATSDNEDAPPPEHTDTDASDPSDTPLLRALGYDPLHLDVLQERTGQDIPTLTAQLLELELAGHIARLEGGRFQRLKS